MWPTHTRSSFIAGLRRGDRKAALPALCNVYWAPVFEFLCGKGCAPADAHDVTQAFFVAMLKPGFFTGYDPARGKFRSWLRTAAKYFYFNWIREHGHEQVAADPAGVERQLEGVSDTTSAADRAFDQAFTDIVVRRALDRLQRWYADHGQQALFAQLHLAVLGERRRADDAATSKRVGKSISLLKKHRYDEKQEWTLRYQGCLREEIAALGVRRASIDSVIAELRDASR